jgi:hypothetical protein
MQSSESLKKAIRIWIIIFIIAVVLSGVTAFALDKELAWLIFLREGSLLLFKLYVGITFFFIKALKQKIKNKGAILQF